MIVSVGDIILGFKMNKLRYEIKINNEIIFKRCSFCWFCLC